MMQMSCKQLAIKEVAALMAAYTEYVQRIKEEPFTPEIRE